MNNNYKSEFRSYFKNVRNSIIGSEIERKSELICKNFINFFSDSQTYFIYKSFSSEVKTGDMIEYLLNNNKIVTIPRCFSDDNLMLPVEINLADTFSQNIYGIEEKISIDYFHSQIDVVVLPGLAFDKKGNRIGYGKGYYDRFLNSLNYKPKLVALAYSEQIYDENLPCDSNDVICDFIVTEDGIIKTE